MTTAPAPSDHRVDVGGLTLAVRRWDGSGTPFVLVHGLASNARTWDAVADDLAAAGSAVATVDLRGHGRSDKPDSGYDSASVVADLIGVVEELGWDRPVLVGQSWGGNLALAYAWTAPDTVRGVAGVDGGTIDLQTRWPVWEDCARDLAPPSVAGKTLDELAAELRDAHPEWSAEAVDAALANYAVRDDGTVEPRLHRDHHLAALRGLWEQRPSSLYAEVSVPVLLLPAGDRDASWTNDKQAEIDAAAAALPRVRVRWFPDSDHDVHLQRPAEVAQALRARSTTASSPDRGRGSPTGLSPGRRGHGRRYAGRVSPSPAGSAAPTRCRVGTPAVALTSQAGSRSRWPVGAALLSVGHAGVSLPLLSALGPGGDRAVPPAVVAFAVATVLATAVAVGAFRRRAWAWALGLAVFGLTALGAVTPYRGVGSAVGIALGLAGVAVLLSPAGRAALLTAGVADR